MSKKLLKTLTIACVALFSASYAEASNADCQAKCQRAKAVCDDGSWVYLPNNTAQEQAEVKRMKKICLDRYNNCIRPDCVQVMKEK
jgi:hypothetical protein